MAGLTNTLSDTQETSTSMPAWYDQAQQNIVSQGANAMANAPSLSQTTGQNAINTLQGPNNPFTQAQGTLNQISSGAANPWIVDQSTGAVTPNTGTAMGGLFAAQQQELNQLMPNYSAPMQAGAIGSGNFGSLRGQTAVQKGRGDAFAKLNAQQLQAALTNQQQGVAAATGLGNVGQQGINANMNVGQTQMNAPFNNLANYSSLISSMQTPTTTKSQVQMSPLTQAATLANTLQGTGVTGGLGSLFFGSGATGSPTLANGQPNPLYKAATSGLFGSGGAGGGALSGLGTSLQKYFSGLNFGDTPNTVSETLPDGTPNPDFIGPVDGGGGSTTEQDLYDQESGNNNYTPDQLDDYQNYYSTNDE